VGKNSSIEWCDHTWSPWVGCQKLSPACDNCYAEAINRRFNHGENWGPHAPRRLTADWELPERWNAQAERAGVAPKVFPSMCDPFDNAVSREWFERFFELIRRTPHLTWLLLTKRPQNIIRMVRRHGAIAGNGTRYLPDNAWLGATCEDQKRVDQNLPALHETREQLGARTLFASFEPLLEAVDLQPHLARGLRLDWALCGGESGHRARPMHPAWARGLRDQCHAGGIKFFFKQWGSHVAGELAEHPTASNESTAWRVDGRGERWHDPQESDKPRAEWVPVKFIKVSKKSAGRLLDGRLHHEFPGAVRA
jgi:protein gp37